jgi:hypothetical protein
VGPGRGDYGPRRAGEHDPTGESGAGQRPSPGPTQHSRTSGGFLPLWVSVPQPCRSEELVPSVVL